MALKVVILYIFKFNFGYFWHRLAFQKSCINTKVIGSFAFFARKSTKKGHFPLEPKTTNVVVKQFQSGGSSLIYTVQNLNQEFSFLENVSGLALWIPYICLT